MERSRALADQVKTNLTHYNLWSDVKSYEIANYDGSNIFILDGIPPEKLEVQDTKGGREWVIPKLMALKKDLSVKEIENWFVQISHIAESGIRPPRVTIGLVNDDATIVYYFIHDGIVKPRQN